jgi:chemotaxis signal transduction protein
LKGKTDFRGKMVPVINLRKIFKMPLQGGTALLILKSAKGNLGILVDAVSEIITTDQAPAPLPAGLMNPGIKYYRGILRHGDRLALLLNEDGLIS